MTGDPSRLNVRYFFSNRLKTEWTPTGDASGCQFSAYPNIVLTRTEGTYLTSTLRPQCGDAIRLHDGLVCVELAGKVGGIEYSLASWEELQAVVEVQKQRSIRFMSSDWDVCA